MEFWPEFYDSCIRVQCPLEGTTPPHLTIKYQKHNTVQSYDKMHDFGFLEEKLETKYRRIIQSMTK